MSAAVSIAERCDMTSPDALKQLRKNATFVSATFLNSLSESGRLTNESEGDGTASGAQRIGSLCPTPRGSKVTTL